MQKCPHYSRTEKVNGLPSHLFPISERIMLTIYRLTGVSETIGKTYGTREENRPVLCLQGVTMLQGCHVSGKSQEKQNFLQVRELSGNFEKMSGNFGHLINVRELSGNFVITIFFSKNYKLSYDCILFQVVHFCEPCFTQNTFPS